MYTLVWREDGGHTRGNFTVELLRPLASPHFLSFVFKRRGLTDAGRQLHLYCRERGLAPATWRSLARHDSRFLRPAWRRAESGQPAQAAVVLIRWRGWSRPVRESASDLAARYNEVMRGMRHENEGR